MKILYNVTQGLTKLSVFFLILLTFGTEKSDAQTATTVNVTVNITPPYSPFYADYSSTNASKVLLLVQNLTATTKTLKLTGQLQGDNGIKISTKSNYVPLQPIVLNPNETKQLNGLALQDIFDLNSLNVYGIDKSRLIYTSRLPEGNYTFCIQAVDMATNQILSANAPLGCTSISILYPDAPFLINPLSNSTTTGINTISFAWGNNIILPMGIEYTLQISEMPNNVKTDPNQLLNSTSFPLITKRIINGTSTVLLPSDPPLKIGKRYAWRVIAKDPRGLVVFKNNGISNANEFRFGEILPFVPSVVILKKPENNRGIEDFSKLGFSWKFTDNSELNDNVGFYNGGLSRVSNLSLTNNSSTKYELRIVKIKTKEELEAERVARMRTISPGPVDNGIVISVNKDTIDYNSTPAIANYVKDENSYEWSVKHLATGAVSETRSFTMKVQSSKSKTLSLVGNLRYNFYDQYMAGAPKRAEIAKENEKKIDGQPSKIILTEEEKGFPLANKNLHVLKVTLLAPVYRVTKKVKIKENGVDVIRSEETDSIAPLSDLLKTYTVNTAPKLSSAIIVKTGTTDVNGDFKIDVPINLAQFKVIDLNIKLTGKNYALVEGLVIKVDDNRFSDPNWYVVPNAAGSVVALGESTVEVFGYKLIPELVTANGTITAVKGKLFLLRNPSNVFKGEVENKITEKKDLATYSTVYLDGKANVTTTGTSSYAMVASHDIDVPAYTPNFAAVIAKQSFSNLVTSLSSNDDYTVFYEPSKNGDAVYYSPQKVSNLNGKKMLYESTAWTKRDLSEKVSFKPKFVSMQISGRYTYTWKQPNGKTNIALPLPEGTVIELVKGNLPQRSASQDEPTFTDRRLITTTTVKKNGEYTFNVGLTDYDTFNDKNTNDLAVAIVSKYYFADPYSINTNTQQNVKLPDLNATVRQFSFTGRISYLDRTAGVNTKYIEGMQVYLCREVGESVPFDRPRNDGDPEHSGYFKKIYELKDKKRNVVGQYEIIDKTFSVAKGVFSFNRLVVPVNNGENYHVFAEPKSDSQDNYESINDYTIIRDWDYTNKNIKKGTFSNEQSILKIDYTRDLTPSVDVEPLSPYIDGAVYPNSNASTTVLTKVLVEMFNMPEGSKYLLTDEEYETLLKNKVPVVYDMTESDGRFLFENADVPYGWKLLRFTKQGFLPTYKVVNIGKPLPKGSRGNLQKVFMNLPKDVYVTVKNSDKTLVAARVIVGNDFSWMDYLPGSSLSKTIARTPKGNVNFSIIPVDQANYKTTTVTKTIDDNTSNLEFVVAKMEHTLIVKCYKEGTKTLLAAEVTVLNTANFKANAFDNYLGRGTMSVVSIPAGGTQFDLKVTPKDINYTIAKTQIHSNGRDIVEVEVYVKPAIKLTVTATQEYMKYVKIGMFGSFESAKEKATDYNVFIKELNEDEYVFEEGFTLAGAMILRQGGTRVISRIPSTLAVTVSVTKTGYIGESKVCFPWGQNMAQSFNLTLAPNMNVNSIYGFPIELTKAEKQPNGQYVISGRLNPDVVSGNLTLKNKSDKLEFRNVFVNLTNAPSGLEKDRYFTLANGIVFTQNSIDAKLFNNFEVKVISNNGLSLLPKTSTTGSIAGKVSLDPSSFSKGVTISGSALEGNNNYLYLNELTKAYTGITTLPNNKTSSVFYTFSTAQSDLTASSYLVSTVQGSLPTFQGADGLIVVPDKEVKLGSTAMMFAGKVSTNLKNTATPNIQAKATFVLSKESFYSVGQQPFAIKLRNWDLNIASWDYGTTGFRANGSLNTQGLTIPFTDLDLAYDKIGFGVFDVNKLKLLNTFPVALNSGQVNVSFGFDKGYSKIGGAWSVSVLSNNANPSIASIKGLEDLKNTDEIKIKNISLYDTNDENDTRILLVDDQPFLTLNGIAKFRPGYISGTSEFIKFRGDLNMDIPGFTGLEAITYDLKYRVEGGKLRHKHEDPFVNLGLDTKGILVNFKTTNQKFTSGTLELYGTLTDKDPAGKDKYKIPVKLTKTENSTTLDVIAQDNGNKFIYLNEAEKSTYLADASGGTSVIDKQWDYFKFKGNLISGEGIKPSPMEFIIKGDIVANSSQLGVRNMGDDMKSFSIAYDFKQAALLGSGHLSQKMDFASLELDAELKIGKATDWYIFASGKASVDMVPIFKDIGVAFMVGNTTISDSQRTAFYKHFGGNIKPSDETLNTFKGNLGGIIFMVSAEFKIPLVPTFNLNLNPVAHCDFTNGLYAATFFKLNFASGAEIAVGGRVGAYVKLGAGASIGLACAGVSLRAETGAEIIAKLNLSNKTFLASLALNFELQGSAYVGVGVCDSDCETVCVKIPLVGKVCSPIKCYKAYYSKKLSIGAAATLSNNGISLKSPEPVVTEN